MTMLAHEYVVIQGEIVVSELLTVPADQASAVTDDVLPVPWRRVAIGSAVGVLIALLLSGMHTGFESIPVLAAEVTIMGAGLAIMGSFIACLSTLATRR